MTSKWLITILIWSTNICTYSFKEDSFSGGASAMVVVQTAKCSTDADRLLPKDEGISNHLIIPSLSRHNPMKKMPSKFVLGVKKTLEDSEGL